MTSVIAQVTETSPRIFLELVTRYLAPSATIGHIDWLLVPRVTRGP